MGNIYLMVSQSKVTKQTIVPEHILSEFHNLRFVLEVKVAFKETLVKFYDLSQREMLTRSPVKSPCSLNKLKIYINYQKRVTFRNDFTISVS